MEKSTILGDIDFQNKLLELGFKNLGSGWFEFKNQIDVIRIRLWRDNEIDFWLMKGSESFDNQIRFTGKIYSIEDVKWVLERCFNVV